MPHFTVELCRPQQMTTADVAAWNAIQGAVPAFSNPLFGHGFACAVAGVRDDVRVAVVRRDHLPVAFLAHHRRPGGFARPIGAPFSDYQGIVSNGDIGLDGPTILKMAGLSALRFNGLVDPFGLFTASDLGVQDAFAIELDGEPEAYLETIRASSPKKFKNYRRLEHKLEREVGPLTLVTDDRRQDSFDALMSWKSEQFSRTGIQDVLRPQWVRMMMKGLFDDAGETFGGLMVTLYAGETLVAGHFGIRQGSVFHPWIASANPDHASSSPGQAFLSHVIRAMPAMGLTVYDLGPGHDHYKRPYASVQRRLGAGLVVAGGMQGRVAGAKETAWSVGGLGRIAAVSKVRRRLDHIAAVDPSAVGRVRGVLEAVQGARKRGLGNHTLSEGAA